MSSRSQLTYAARAQNHPNVLTKKLFEIAEEKKTNVTVSADVTTTKELLDLADRKLAPTVHDSAYLCIYNRIMSWFLIHTQASVPISL